MDYGYVTAMTFRYVPSVDSGYL